MTDPDKFELIGLPGGSIDRQTWDEMPDDVKRRFVRAAYGIADDES